VPGDRVPIARPAVVGVEERRTRRHRESHHDRCRTRGGGAWTLRGRRPVRRRARQADVGTAVVGAGRLRSSHPRSASADRRSRAPVFRRRSGRDSNTSPTRRGTAAGN
jgi:hypothetical protein